MVLGHEFGRGGHCLFFLRPAHLRVGEAIIPVPSEDASDGLERNVKRNIHVAAYWSSAGDDRNFRDPRTLRRNCGDSCVVLGEVERNLKKDQQLSTQRRREKR